MNVTVRLQTSMGRGPLQTLVSESGTSLSGSVMPGMPFRSGTQTLSLGKKDGGLLGFANPQNGGLSVVFDLAALAYAFVQARRTLRRAASALAADGREVLIAGSASASLYSSKMVSRSRSVRAMCPSRLDEPAFVDWLCALEREGASPGAALDLLDMNAAIDLRPELAKVVVPTTILTAKGDMMTRPEAGEFLAREIPNARHVTVEGDDHTLLFDHHELLANELERLAARTPAED